MLFVWQTTAICNIIKYKIASLYQTCPRPQRNLFQNQEQQSHTHTQKIKNNNNRIILYWQNLVRLTVITSLCHIKLQHTAINFTIVPLSHTKDRRKKEKKPEQYFMGNCNLKWSQLIFNSSGVWHRVPIQGHPLKSMGKRPRGFTGIFLFDWLYPSGLGDRLSRRSRTLFRSKGADFRGLETG